MASYLVESHQAHKVRNLDVASKIRRSRVFMISNEHGFDHNILGTQLHFVQMLIYDTDCDVIGCGVIMYDSGR